MSQNLNQDKLLKTPSPSFSVDKVNEIANELYGISGTLSQLGSERDQNFHLITATGDQFVIKIANSSEDPAILYPAPLDWQFWM